jgi:DNA primase large subunit
MATYSKQEIALVLQAAETLNQKGSSQKINVSTFCREAGISRKNAYKHKNNIDLSQNILEEQMQQLELDNQQLREKLKLAEARAGEADLYSELRNILVALHDDIKKNEAGSIARQPGLIKSSNSIGN